MKEFLVLIREHVDAYSDMSPEEMQQCIDKHIKWVEEITAGGHYQSASPLEAEGKLIKGKDKLVTDGPYIELKETVSGFYLLRANSLVEATEIAKGCPDLLLGATLEVRELMPTE